jgi:hypothetical protein
MTDNVDCQQWVDRNRREEAKSRAEEHAFFKEAPDPAESKIPDPSEEEINDFFTKNQAQMPPGSTLETIRPQLIDYLKQQRGKDVATNSRKMQEKQAAAAASSLGSLNLRASDTADVYVDGRKVGGSPILGHQVKAGSHQVRFDCLDPQGEAKKGIAQTVEVPTDGERDVEYECPGTN